MKTSLSKCLLLASLCSIYAQTPTPPPAAAVPAPAPATDPAPTAEISVDLVVRDEKGRPASDLKAPELLITDEGAPVKISDLHLVTGSGEHFVTLVFDKLDPAGAKAAREAANEILKTAPAEGITFSVLTIDGRLRLVQQFTTDREAIRQAILTLTGGAKVGYVEGSKAAEKALQAEVQKNGPVPEATTPESRAARRANLIARSTLAALLESQRIIKDQHAKPHIAAMLALTRTQDVLNGKKAVVYFSQGPQLDSAGRNMMLSVIGAAHRACLSIYSVDVNPLDSKTGGALLAASALSNTNAGGISTGTTTGSAATGSSSMLPQGTATSDQGAYGLTADQARRLATSRDQPADNGFLTQLAESTGGEYIAVGSDVRKPARRMIEDLTSYYHASYVPLTQPGDGRFHRLSVKSSRRGLKIQAYSGYDALATVAASGVLPFEAPLLTTLAQPQYPSDIIYQTSVFRFGSGAKSVLTAVVVETPLSEIETLKDPNTKLYSAHVSVVAQIRDKSGAVVTKFSEDIPRQGAIEALEKAQSDVITFEQHFVAPPGEYTLETAVMDRNSKKLGAQRKSFEIPKPADGPSLSDVVLVLRTEPAPPEGDSEDPLRNGSNNVLPNLTGKLDPADDHVSFYFMVRPDSNSKEASKLEIEVRRNGEEIAREPLEMRKDEDDGPAPYMAALKTESLYSGAYEVSAILTQGSHTIRSTTSFSLVGKPGNPPPVVIGPNPDESVAETTKFATTPDVPRLRKSLVITSATAAPPPPTETIEAILKGAAERSTDYAAMLPNFMCIELIRRSLDPAHNGHYRRLDTITELLRYHDQEEKRTVLQVNGVHSTLVPGDLKGTMSDGEFGGLLDAVFNPEVKADFHWKEMAMLGSGKVQVFTYRVPVEHSRFSIIGSTNSHLKVGFHGLVYIDSSTYGVRRLTLEADGIPKDFPTHGAEMSVDYDYVAISGHDYLMPITGIVKAIRGKRYEQNEMEFRDYKKYGAESSIHFDTTSK